jgi:hypothetical protein
MKWSLLSGKFLNIACRVIFEIHQVFSSARGRKYNEIYFRISSLPHAEADFRETQAFGSMRKSHEDRKLIVSNTSYLS